MKEKLLYSLIEICLNYVKSNLDEFNDALDKSYTEKDIEDCIDLVNSNLE